MGQGYERQEAANIVTGNVIEDSHLNNELNQVEAAFNGTTGHSHDGTTGEGPQINLTTSVSGTLPIANGGTNATSAGDARTNLGLAIGTDVQAFDAQLTDISGLTPTDGVFIVGDGVNFVAESGSTARASLGLGSLATQAYSSVNITGGTINGTTIGASTATTASFTSIGLEDATNQIVLDSDAANTGTITMASLSTSRTYTLPDETGTIVTTALTSSDSQAGIVELATSSEIDISTDTTRAMSRGEFSDSRYGKIPVTFPSSPGIKTATGDGWSYFHIPSALNGMNLVEVEAFVVTAGTTGTTDIQIANVTQGVDILSTKLTIDSGETNSSSAVAAVIDTANDDVATGDVLRVDIDAVSTTPAEGLVVILYFRIP